MLRGHGLGLRLQVLECLAQRRDPGLELVDGIVQRLYLSGDAVDLPGGRVVLGFDVLGERVHGHGHLVDRVRGLLNEMLQNAHPLRVGLLHLLEAGLQLLDLGLQLNDFFGGGVGARNRDKQRQRCEGEGSERDGNNLVHHG